MLGPCATACGQAAREAHHIYPVQHGGALNGPTINLCPTCHTRVHTIADAVWAKRPHESIGSAVINKLVHCCLEQRRVFAANGGLAPDARRRIVAQLSQQELDDAHAVKLALGFRSIESMLKGLIAREARRLKAGG